MQPKLGSPLKNKKSVCLLFVINIFIIQNIVTLPKYGHDALNIRPQSKDIQRDT